MKAGLVFAKRNLGPNVSFLEKEMSPSPATRLRKRL